MATRKMNLKGATKSLGKNATNVALTAAGIIAGQKFLSADAIGQAPDSMYAKNEGYIKLAAGVFGMGMVKNEMLKSVLAGVAINGGLNVASSLMKNTGGGTTQSVGYYPTPSNYYRRTTLGNEQPSATNQQINAGVSGVYNQGIEGPGSGMAAYDGIPMAVGAF